MSTSIFILGIGNLGKYLAYALCHNIPRPIFTLLFHRPDLAEEFKAAGYDISCTSDGQTHRIGPFGGEILDDGADKTLDWPIRHLIVATKAPTTLAALKPIAHRLDQKTNIVVLQNGMGAVEEVTASLFPNPRTRPTFWAGIYNTGIYSKGAFSIVLAGRPEMTLGPLSSISEQQLKSSYLIQNMLRAEQLNATYANHSEIKKAQLLKLVVNAMINPLTVIFNCKNGELFGNATRLGLMAALLLEAGAVVRAILQEDGSSAGSDEFTHETLKQRVLEIAEKTAANTSSMLQDVKAGRGTEIDYINGYIVHQGQRLGVPCPRNLTLVDLVKKREVIVDANIHTRFT